MKIRQKISLPNDGLEKPEINFSRKVILCCKLSTKKRGKKASKGRRYPGKRVAGQEGRGGFEREESVWTFHRHFIQTQSVT